MSIGRGTRLVLGIVTSTCGGTGVGPIKGLAGKCLDVRSGGTADGTQIQLYTCNSSAAQTWTVTPNSTS